MRTKPLLALIVFIAALCHSNIASAETPQLGALREAHPALSTGGSFVRVAQEGLLAVSRIDHAARREYLALFNASEEPR